MEFSQFINKFNYSIAVPDASVVFDTIGDCCISLRISGGCVFVLISGIINQKKRVNRFCKIAI